MAAGKSVTDILAGAKDALNKANAFTDSAAKESGHPAQPHVDSAPPKHEYSSAPYTLAKEANDTGKGVKARMDMEAKARKALQ